MTFDRLQPLQKYFRLCSYRSSFLFIVFFLFNLRFRLEVVLERDLDFFRFLLIPKPLWLIVVSLFIPSRMVSRTLSLTASFRERPSAASFAICIPVCRAFLPITGANILMRGNTVRNRFFKIFRIPWPFGFSDHKTRVIHVQTD